MSEIIYKAKNNICTVDEKLHLKYPYTICTRSKALVVWDICNGKRRVLLSPSLQDA